MATEMFCYQCEQTAMGKGCTKIGVCGKNANAAALQDLLIYSLIGLSEVAVEGRMHGVEDHEADAFTMKALFTTLTNVNFDEADLAGYINRSVELRERLKSWVRKASSTAQFTDGPASFKPANDLNGLIEQGTRVGLKSDVYAAEREHPVAAACHAVRHQGRRRLCGPRADTRPGGQKSLCIHPRRASPLCGTRSSA